MKEDIYYEYSFSYIFDNSKWSISIFARNEKEAKDKFESLKENGKYDYKIEMTIPVIDITQN